MEGNMGNAFLPDDDFDGEPLDEGQYINADGQIANRDSDSPDWGKPDKPEPPPKPQPKPAIPVAWDNSSDSSDIDELAEELALKLEIEEATRQITAKHEEKKLEEKN